LTLTVALGACDETAAPIGSPRPPAIGVGGSTGSSSTATTSGSTTAQGVFGCACVAATASQGCANCYNEVTAAGSACSAKSLQCQSSEACRAGFVCLNQCEFAPECVADCLLVAKAGQGLPLLEALFACTCGACGDACRGVATAGCDGGAGGSAGAGAGP
jgi:hypothetical protein